MAIERKIQAIKMVRERTKATRDHLEARAKLTREMAELRTEIETLNKEQGEYEDEIRAEKARTAKAVELLKAVSHWMWHECDRQPLANEIDSFLKERDEETLNALRGSKPT